jgi:hypothetical protein
MSNQTLADIDFRLMTLIEASGPGPVQAHEAQVKTARSLGTTAVTEEEMRSEDSGTSVLRSRRQGFQPALLADQVTALLLSMVGSDACTAGSLERRHFDNCCRVPAEGCRDLDCLQPPVAALLLAKSPHQKRMRSSLVSLPTSSPQNQASNMRSGLKKSKLTRTLVLEAVVQSVSTGN